MGNETLFFVSSEVADLFNGLAENSLADVLRVWDCDSNTWYDSFAAVFRFENDDLLVWYEHGSLQAKKGAIDTRELNPSFSEALTKALASGVCLSWRLDSDYSDLIGMEDLGSELVARVAKASSDDAQSNVSD